MEGNKKQVSGNDKNRNEVLKLEAIRKERGYKRGWLYFRCKAAGLLDTLKQLE